MASPNSSSSTPVSSYDVFPNFHGSDVRRGFLSHLHFHFASKGIKTFNDNKIKRGHTIGPELVQAIKESIVSIVVLSKNYASSSWCLDELVEIFKCKEAFGQIVMTIFYDVDPSDVKKQKGDFGKAFEETCEGKTEEVKQKWTEALEHVATIAGEHSLNWANEIEMIQKIATDVSNVKSLRYDVFPSFCGEDVRKRFLSHLHYHLAIKGIRMFDDQKINRGHGIEPEVLQALKEARISIVVLSKNYASSSWCLNELVEVLKCREEFGQIVITIFYDVHPSDVRKQKGDFGKAFEMTCQGKTEEMKQRWRQALSDVTSLVGYDSLTWDNEAKMIQQIARDVSETLYVRRSR